MEHMGIEEDGIILEATRRRGLGLDLRDPNNNGGFIGIRGRGGGKREAIVIFVWLVFLIILVTAVAGFYGWSFMYIGAPSFATVRAYGLVALLTFLLYTALIIGIWNLRDSPENPIFTPGARKHFILGYNIAMALSFVFTTTLTMQFSKDISRADVLAFFRNYAKHPGAANFLRFLHNSFNCCSLLSQDFLDHQVSYGLVDGEYEVRENDTTVFLLSEPGCHEEDIKGGLNHGQPHHPGCLDNVTSLAQLYGMDKTLKEIHTLQVICPIVLLLSLVVLLILFNSFFLFRKEGEGEDNDNDSPEYNENPVDRMHHYLDPNPLFTGFAMQGGSRIPSSRDFPTPVHP